jgi:hypothetical protein
MVSRRPQLQKGVSNSEPLQYLSNRYNALNPKVQDPVDGWSMKHLTDVLRTKLSGSLSTLKLIFPTILLHYFPSNLVHKVQSLQ